MHNISTLTGPVKAGMAKAIFIFLFIYSHVFIWVPLARFCCLSLPVYPFNPSKHTLRCLSFYISPLFRLSLPPSVSLPLSLSLSMCNSVFRLYQRSFIILFWLRIRPMHDHRWFPCVLDITLKLNMKQKLANIHFYYKLHVMNITRTLQCQDNERVRKIQTSCGIMNDEQWRWNILFLYPFLLSWSGRENGSSKDASSPIIKSQSTTQTLPKVLAAARR